MLVSFCHGDIVNLALSSCYRVIYALYRVMDTRLPRWHHRAEPVSNSSTKNFHLGHRVRAELIRNFLSIQKQELQ